MGAKSKYLQDIQERWEKYDYPLDETMQHMVPKRPMPKSMLGLFARVEQEGLTQQNTSLKGEDWQETANGQGAYLNLGTSKVSFGQATYQLSVHWKHYPQQVTKMCRGTRRPNRMRYKC